MKTKIGFIEFLLLVLSFTLVLAFLISFCSMTFLMWFIYFPIIPCAIILSILNFKSRKLPGTSKYNLWGMIELHIDRKNHKKRRLFYSLCANAILTAKAEKRKVIVCTWLTTKDKIIDRFGNAITFYEPTAFDFFFSKINSYFYSKYKKTKVFPLIKFIINTENLSIDSIEYLNEYA